jgi:hypothetical protein
MLNWLDHPEDQSARIRNLRMVVRPQCRSAFRKPSFANRDGKITEEEYICQLIAHFRGVWHPEDSRDNFKAWDPFGASIRAVAVESNYPMLQAESLFPADENFVLTQQSDRHDPIWKTLP